MLCGAEDDRASLPSASGMRRVSSLLHPLTNTLLAAAPGILILLCVYTSTAWCCCGSQVGIMDGKFQSPSYPALLKALETSTEHQVTGSGVTSCCFDAASQKENLFGPCSLRSFLFMWNTYFCSLQELCTPLGCSGIYLGYQRQCWGSQSSFSASLQFAWPSTV